MLKRLLPPLLTCCFLFLAPFGGQAQAGARAMVHVDKAFYVLGEAVWYSVALPGGADEPGLLEAVLYAPDGQPIDRYRLALEAGRAAGYQKLAYDWPAGRYRLLFYLYDRERRSRLPVTQVSLPVYDDLAATPEEAPSSDKPTTAALSGTLLVKIDLPAAPARAGEMLRATFRVEDTQGRPVRATCSIAVTDATLSGREGPVGAWGAPLPAGLRPDSLLHLQGQVTDSSGSAFPTPFLGAFLLPGEGLTITRPDRQGQFDMALPPFYGRGAVQLADYKGYPIRINLDTPSALPPAAPLLYDASVLQYLEWSRRRKKIYQLFQKVEMPIEAERPPGPNSADNPDQRLQLDDYTPMDDLVSFFREVTTPLKFRRQGGHLIARMFNPGVRRFYPGSPLFLLDGQATWDAEEIVQLDLSDLATIDLYFYADALRDHFGAFGRYGVVVIQSRSKALRLPETFQQNRFSVEGLQAPAYFPALPDGGVPRFRPQLFWAPSVQTDEEGLGVIEFRQSDALSTFRIDIVARAADGRIGTGVQSYQVVRP